MRCRVGVGGGHTWGLCVYLHVCFPPLAVQTRCYFLPQMLVPCISKFRHSAQSFCFFMDFAFLFLSFLQLRERQREREGEMERERLRVQCYGCCVMSVIALILPFSQCFNLFMLLPNLYWGGGVAGAGIICILYMITFPLLQWLDNYGLAHSRWHV